MCTGSCPINKNKKKNVPNDSVNILFKLYPRNKICTHEKFFNFKKKLTSTNKNIFLRKNSCLYMWNKNFDIKGDISVHKKKYLSNSMAIKPMSNQIKFHMSKK